MNRKNLQHIIFLILIALLSACSATKREKLPEVSLIVTNGIIIDGTGADLIRDGLIAIQENRIVAIGQSDDFIVPDDVLVIDAAGGTIMPGIFNAHAHRVSTAATRRHLFLLDGVTSVCDLGVPLVRMGDFDQEEIQSGPAARGFKAGPMITPPNGYPGLGMNYEIQGEDGAENAVRDLNSRGVDYIKVALEPGPMLNEYFPVLNLQELQSIVTTAHELGLLVRAHVYDSTMLNNALEAGVDVIEHLPLQYDSQGYLVSFFDEIGEFRMPTELEAQYVQMIEQGIVLVPTLEVNTRDENMWGDLGVSWDEFIQVNLNVVRYFHEIGGKIAIGNDYGVPSVKPGIPLREMVLLQEAGLTSQEIIEAATRQAAYVCGQADSLGTLEIGKIADLIIVADNPLEDINALDTVMYVIKNGKIIVSPLDDGK